MTTAYDKLPNYVRDFNAFLEESMRKCHIWPYGTKRCTHAQLKNFENAAKEAYRTHALCLEKWSISCLDKKTQVEVIEQENNRKLGITLFLEEELEKQRAKVKKEEEEEKLKKTKNHDIVI